MKRWRILITVCILSLPLIVFANSGPIVPRHVPSEGFIVQVDSPITVEKEDLLFDFSNNDDSYRIEGRITASYTMMNPTNEPQSVLMAFPFIGSLENTAARYSVLSDGEEVPSDLYIIARTGYTADETIQYDFSSIVNRITSQPNNTNYSEEEMENEWIKDWLLVLTYTIEFPATSKKEITINYTGTGKVLWTQDRERPMYVIDYVLNPARYWADFKNLTIKIIPPDEVPYIVKSSTPFKQAEDGTYSASLGSLPEEDLYFYLYEHNTLEQEVIHAEVPEYRMRSSSEEAAKAFKRVVMPSFIIIVSISAIVGVSGIMVMLVKRAKKKAKED